jgi:hypothetical protein
MLGTIAVNIECPPFMKKELMLSHTRSMPPLAPPINVVNPTVRSGQKKPHLKPA